MLASPLAGAEHRPQARVATTLGPAFKAQLQLGLEAKACAVGSLQGSSWLCFLVFVLLDALALAADLALAFGALGLGGFPLRA